LTGGERESECLGDYLLAAPKTLLAVGKKINFRFLVVVGGGGGKNKL
jgi:hypothetical protein